MKNELELKEELKDLKNYLKYQKHLNKDKDQIFFNRKKLEALDEWITKLTEYVYGNDEDPDEDKVEKFEQSFDFPNGFTMSITDFWVVQYFINFLLKDENE